MNELHILIQLQKNKKSYHTDTNVKPHGAYQQSNMYSCKFREENRFPEFDNVLDIKCTQNSTCLFALNDYVI